MHYNNKSGIKHNLNNFTYPTITFLNRMSAHIYITYYTKYVYTYTHIYFLPCKI